MISDLEIVNNKKKTRKTKTDSKKAQEKPQAFTRQQTQDKMNTCKYCLEEESLDDPLITPCKCSGTMSYVHLNCLQKWAKEKISKIENDYITIYTWEDLVCDLCKTPITSILLIFMKCKLMNFY